MTDTTQPPANHFMVDGIDEAITEAVRDGKEIVAVQIAAPMWDGFKGAVPRNERRQRQGSRFVDAYRSVPITIHDEWEWGWRLLITGEEPLEVEE